jgi:hypothetical protein
MPLQSPQPGSQLRSHAPDRHTPTACGASEQAFPHRPQWSGFISVSTQLSPQRIVPTGQLAVQLNPTEAFPAQSGVAPGQAAPQSPQAVGLANEVSHPVSVRVSQFPQPGSHTSPQRLSAQSLDACAGETGQALSHRPQCAAETRTSVSHPFSARPSQLS